jgi:hypothetical protein
MSKNTISRKRFIKTAAAGVIFANLGTLSAQTENTVDKLGAKRIQLKEAGPMLPPVPAA